MASHGAAADHHGKSDFVGRTTACARAFGLAHETMDGEEAMRCFPQIRNATGANAFFEPGGGFVHPERCIEAQLGEARRVGTRILRADIGSVSQDRGGVRIDAGGDVVEAEHAIVAAGAWTASLMGAPFDRLLRVSRQVLHWFPADDTLYASGRFPVIIWMHGRTEEDYFYAFPSLPGSGALKAATEQYGISTSADAVDRQVAAGEGAALHWRSLADRLTGVSPAPLRSVACLYTNTPDSGFIIDRHPAMDRVTVVSACSGHGFKHSAGIGELLARAHCDGQALPSAFGLARFDARL
jgi:sarcosine oxidase